ncbi:MAG: hypothetical protein P1U50_01170 [Parvibaculaceae bacterium]|nr:hypothetical protein [Parvibaculaceae bacterium]
MSSSFNVVSMPLPLGIGPRHIEPMKVGRSIRQIIDAIPMDKLPVRSNMRVIVSNPSGETEIHHKMWDLVRPKEGSIVSIQMAPAGGDDSSIKTVIAVVVAIAIIATGHLELLEIPAWLMEAATAVAISSAAALATSALSRPPAAQARGEETTTDTALGSASAQGNVLSPGGSIPVVLGRRKVFPPLACEPLVETINRDEIVEATYVLDGPHDLENIRIDDVAVEELEGVEIETREGWDDDLNVLLYRRYGYSDQVQKQLQGYRVNETSTQQLDDQTSPENSLPSWEQFATEKSPDEIWLSLFWGGFVFGDDASSRAGVPVRFRVRERGESDWKNLPEVHFVGSELQNYRIQVKIKWGELGSVPTPPTSTGPFVAFKEVPGQTGTVTAGWEAHSSFDDGSEDLDGVQNVAMYPDLLEFYLDEADFPRGVKYEVEAMIGCMYKQASLNTTTYAYKSNVRDLFYYYENGGALEVAEDQDTVANRCTVARISSVYNDLMIKERGFCTIVIRGRNIAVQNVSVEAAAYVPDWDGEDWSNWVASENPATHYRNVLVGDRTHPARRENPAQIDEASILAWRQACIDNGWKISAIIEGRTAHEVREMIASTAYARPKSPIWGWGVALDVDRTEEMPVQYFTPRNSANFRWRKPFAETVDGYRVTFDDADNDYQTREITVLHPNTPTNMQQTLEALTYDTITDEDLIRARALHDLKTLRKRSVQYLLDVPMESIVCERGSLVAIANDLLVYQSGSARVLEVITNDSDEVTSLRIDSDLELINEPDFWSITDFWAVENIWNIGVKTAASIRYPLDSATAETNKRVGILTKTLSNSTGRSGLLAFETPFARPEGLAEGALVSAGPVDHVEGRFIVTNVQHSKNLNATLTLVDEAPDLFT